MCVYPSHVDAHYKAFIHSALRVNTTYYPFWTRNHTAILMELAVNSLLD